METLQWASGAEPSDVIICGYPGSGVQWVKAIVEAAKGRGDVTTLHNCNLLEQITTNIDSIPRPRLLCSHLAPRGLAQVGLDLRSACSVILVLRDPRDAAVASCIERSQDMTDVLPHFLHGNGLCVSWFDYTLEWEDVVTGCPGLRVHVVQYEDLMRNLMAEVKKLCDFLHVTYDLARLETWSSRCDLDTLLAAREPPRKRRRTSSTDVTEKPVQANSSEVGIWKHWFTITQSEAFEATYRARMKHSQLCMRYWNHG